MKDPDEVNLDEPITWVAPTLTFICPWLQWCLERWNRSMISMNQQIPKASNLFIYSVSSVVMLCWDMYINISHILCIYIYVMYVVYSILFCPLQWFGLKIKLWTSMDPSWSSSPEVFSWPGPWVKVIQDHPDINDVFRWFKASEEKVWKVNTLNDRIFPVLWVLCTPKLFPFS